MAGSSCVTWSWAIISISWSKRSAPTPVLECKASFPVMRSGQAGDGGEPAISSRTLPGGDGRGRELLLDPQSLYSPQPSASGPCETPRAVGMVELSGLSRPAASTKLGRPRSALAGLAGTEKTRHFQPLWPATGKTGTFGMIAERRERRTGTFSHFGPRTMLA